MRPGNTRKQTHYTIVIVPWQPPCANMLHHDVLSMMNCARWRMWWWWWWYDDEVVTGWCRDCVVMSNWVSKQCYCVWVRVNPCSNITGRLSLWIWPIRHSTPAVYRQPDQQTAPFNESTTNTKLWCDEKTRYITTSLQVVLYFKCNHLTAWALLLFVAMATQSTGSCLKSAEWQKDTSIISNYIFHVHISRCNSSSKVHLATARSTFSAHV